MKPLVLLPATLFLVSTLSFTPGQAEPSLWIGACGGISTYSMSDVNDDISYMNASAGTNMDEISIGPALGIEAGVRVTPGLSLAGGYERIGASTDYSAFDGKLEYNFPANVIYGAVQYFFPSTSSLHVGLGGAIGVVSSAGEIELTIYGSGASSADVTGSGLLMEGRVMGEIYVAPRVALIPSAGYRLANIKEFEIDDETVYNVDGTKMSLDYSGFIMRIGIRFFLN